MPRLFLIDGAALAYRSHFAFIRAPLTTSKGEPTSAIFGFVKTILSILDTEKPDYIAVTFDTAEPTFRHERYAPYKATRERMPGELVAQLPYIEAFIEAFNIPFLVKPGYEADDIMATLALSAEAQGIETLLVSGDKDFSQLVRPKIKIYSMQKGDVEILGPTEVKGKFGVTPVQFVDYLALVGDSSDNVPGVPGIGPKKAVELIEQYGNLEAVLKAAPEMKKSVNRDKLIEFQHQARLSRELVILNCHVPLDQLTIEDLKYRPANQERLIELYKRFEMHSFLSASSKNYQTEAHAYHRIESEADLDRLVEKLKTAEVFSFDLETTSLDTFSAEIVGFSCAVQPREAFYLPANAPVYRLDQSVLPFEACLAKLTPVLMDANDLKGGQNIKYDMLVLLNACGISVEGIAFDSMIAAYLLDPNRRQYGIDQLSQSEFGYKKIPTQALIGEGKHQKNMRDIPVDEVATYACEDADFALRLHQHFTHQMTDPELKWLYQNVEIPLIPVLVRMEAAGISIDPSVLTELSHTLSERLDALTTTIYHHAGETFNINSPKQLGAILFDKLEIHKKLNERKPRQTKTGYATDVDTLERFQGEPLVDAILEYRTLNKLKGTYTDSLLNLVHPKTHRIHTSFNQTIAATGRLSSSDPNLQNIPIRSDIGRLIRKAFVPADPSHFFLAADYSQIELRVLAHVSEDPNLIETFVQDKDVHRRTAELIFGVIGDEVTSNMRSRAKSINFGVIYGMGAQRLARGTGISLQEAQAFIEGYFEKYPKIRNYIDSQIEMAKRLGYVKTILGRRRNIPDIESSNPRLRINSEHIAVNTPIQGSAADLIKVAMIRLDKVLRERKMESRMILQVHDELLFEAPAYEIEDLKALVTFEMEHAITLRVPLKVDVGIGKNWLEAHG